MVSWAQASQGKRVDFFLQHAEHMIIFQHLRFPFLWVAFVWERRYPKMLPYTSVPVKQCTPRADNRFPLDYVDLSGQIDPWSVWSSTRAGWEPYNLHDLGQDSWAGSVIYRSCRTCHIPAVSDVDYLDRDLSEVWNSVKLFLVLACVKQEYLRHIPLLVFHPICCLPHFSPPS